MDSDYPEGQIKSMQTTIDELREKIERITAAWLREEGLWRDLDKDRYRFQTALETIVGEMDDCYQCGKDRCPRCIASAAINIDA